MKKSELTMLIAKIGNSQLRKNLSFLQQRSRDLIDDSEQKYFSRLAQKVNTI